MSAASGPLPAGWEIPHVSPYDRPAVELHALFTALFDVVSGVLVDADPRAFGDRTGGQRGTKR